MSLSSRAERRTSYFLFITVRFRLFHLDLCPGGLAVGGRDGDRHRALLPALDHALGADRGDGRVGAFPGEGRRRPGGLQLDCAGQLQLFALLHAVGGLFKADLRRFANHFDLHAGSNAIVGHHVDRAAANAPGPDLARSVDRGHVAVAAVVAQRLLVGQHLPSGLHALHAGPDLLHAADLQLQAGLVDLYGFGVAVPAVVAAGDGMEHGTGLADIGLDPVDVLPRPNIGPVGHTPVQVGDFVAQDVAAPDRRPVPGLPAAFRIEDIVSARAFDFCPCERQRGVTAA